MNLIQTDVIDAYVAQIVGKGTPNALIEDMKAAMTLSLLGTSLGVLGMALGQSNLATDLLSNLTGIASLQVPMTQIGGQLLQETLGNPLNFYALQLALTEKLALEKGMTKEEAAALIHRAVSGAVGGKEMKDIGQLEAFLRESFQKEGLDAGTINILVGEALGLTKGYIAPLNTDISPERLSALKASLTTVGASTAAVEAAINSAMATGVTAEAGLIALLRKDETMAPYLTTALASLTHPLQTSVQDLSRNILSRLTPQAGTQIAQFMRDEILNNILGMTSSGEDAKNPLSLRNQLEDLLPRLRKAKTEEETKRVEGELANLLRSVLRPNAEIGYVFSFLLNLPETAVGVVSQALKMVKRADLTA